jgi:hypothetical protein
VDTKVTPSVARGVLRVPVNSAGVTASAAYIATTAGLDGDQPTSAAIGPDGNLYVAFLKSGNIKRVVGPGSGSTQVVQSIGGTPNGHPGRALAFMGNDLWIGSVDALSVIPNATNPSCQGGSSVAGTKIQAIFNALHGPWIVSLFSIQTDITTQFVPTFNADGTFTATLTTSASMSTDASVWQLTPPNVVQPFGNPQAHLTLADAQGVVLFSNDILLLNVDRFASETQGTGSLGAPGGTVWAKFAP